MCKCGCNTCDTKSTALVLKESKFVHTPISEGLKYHIDNKIPLNENIYRIGSKEYMKLYEEARSLYSRNKLDVSEDDKYFLTETHVGNFGMFEGKRVPLDIPMLNEYLTESMIGIKTKANFKPLQLKGALERAGIEGFRMDRLSWSLTALKLDKKYFNDAKQIINDLGLSIMMAKESKLNEGYDAYDEIAQAEFSMDYDQLGPNEQEWVRDEYDNQPSGRDSIDEDLCKKGKNYIAKRKRAGEKSSAYLSGRAVRVCKGQIKAEGKSSPYGSGYKKLNIGEIAESLRDWFKKENWVRINTSGNISGDCGTMKKGKATTRCLPKKKAQSLTKAERKATVAKKVRGSKKGKQFVSVKENFEMGDRVKLTPDYEETPGEVFTITQTSGNKYFIADEDGRGWYTYGDQLVMADDEYINEAKKKKKKEKKDPPIGKPKRGGSKAYYVYVRDPKTKKVKKVSFGSGGLRAKIRNPKARKAFAARHNCKNKKDRTKAGYWSCNLPRYAPQLGLGAKMNTFW